MKSGFRFKVAQFNPWFPHSLSRAFCGIFASHTSPSLPFALHAFSFLQITYHTWSHNAQHETLPPRKRVAHNRLSHKCLKAGFHWRINRHTQQNAQLWGNPLAHSRHPRVLETRSGAPWKVGWSCAAHFSNPLLYLTPKYAIFATSFMIWRKIWYPIYVRCGWSGCIKHNFPRAFVDGVIDNGEKVTSSKQRRLQCLRHTPF